MSAPAFPEHTVADATVWGSSGRVLLVRAEEYGGPVSEIEQVARKIAEDFGAPVDIVKFEDADGHPWATVYPGDVS